METTRKRLDIDGPYRRQRRPLGWLWLACTIGAALLMLAALSGHPPT